MCKKKKKGGAIIDKVHFKGSAEPKGGLVPNSRKTVPNINALLH